LVRDAFRAVLLHRENPGHEHEEETAQAAPRIVHVAQPEPGVDEHETRRRFAQQAIAAQLAAPYEAARSPVHQPPAERAGGHAIQVMNALGAVVHDPCRMRGETVEPILESSVYTRHKE
jgi:hypothetical protein